MKCRQLISPALLLMALVPNVLAGVTFGPVRGQPGESVHLVTHAETPGGTIRKTIADKSMSGSINMTRDRDLVWTFRAPTPDGVRRGMVKVNNLSTSTVTKIRGSREEKSGDTSPLNGKMFAMNKAPDGDWKFELDGSVPLTRIQEEIDELTVYLKRSWFPDHEVNVGDTWEFDPVWVKMVIQKDLTKAQTIGTMKLRQVRSAANRRVAIIDISIRSTGADFRADGSESETAIDLAGQATVNLDTMLDEVFEIKGTIATTSSKPGESTKLNLPLNLLVTKSFIKDTAFP